MAGFEKDVFGGSFSLLKIHWDDPGLYGFHISNAWLSAPTPPGTTVDVAFEQRPVDLGSECC